MRSKKKRARSESISYDQIMSIRAEAGDGGPYILKCKRMAGKRRSRGRWSVEYTPTERIGSFSELYKAIAWIASNRKPKIKYYVYLNGKKVYSL